MFGQTIVGTFQLRPNFGGRGAHIGNASYMVHHAHRGVGIGKAMGLFSLDEAKRKGFTAMQFNSVISTNTRAVQLWQSLGFDIIGTVPRAYQHHTQGLVDIYIMYRDL
jgi:GNAT superfamily N-acetyltransferase